MREHSSVRCPQCWRALVGWLAVILGALIMIAFAGRTQAQQVHPNPDCQFFFSFTAAGSSPTSAFDNRQQGCNTWSAVYANSTSGFSGLSLTLQSAADNAGVPATFGAGFPVQQSIIAGANPQTNTTGGYLWIVGTNAFVRVSLSGLTGSGTVQGSVFGWRIPNAGQ